MTMASEFLEEFNNETKTTRKFLERIPEDKLMWKPHEKSMSAGQLGFHIATAPQGVVMLSIHDEVEMPNFDNPQPKSVQEILTAFDQANGYVNEQLPGFSDEKILKSVTFLKDGKTFATFVRKGFFRNVLLNHIYHHRGQLGVYLRLLGAKVPSSYGPSGDEMPTF